MAALANMASHLTTVVSGLIQFSVLSLEGNRRTRSDIQPLRVQPLPGCLASVSRKQTETDRTRSSI